MEIQQEISIVKRILKLSLPVMMGEIMFSILSFVDRFYIAKLGINEAAGSSLSSTIVWVLIALSTLITGGTIALVSRMVGEKNEKGEGRPDLNQHGGRNAVAKEVLRHHAVYSPHSRG